MIRKNYYKSTIKLELLEVGPYVERILTGGLGVIWMMIIGCLDIRRWKSIGLWKK